jgi:hypothetical protein
MTHLGENLNPKFVYDANGNMIDKEGTDLVYDAENRLASELLAKQSNPIQLPLPDAGKGIARPAGCDNPL